MSILKCMQVAFCEHAHNAFGVGSESWIEIMPFLSDLSIFRQQHPQYFGEGVYPWGRGDNLFHSMLVYARGQELLATITDKELITSIQEDGKSCPLSGPVDVSVEKFLQFVETKLAERSAFFKDHADLLKIRFHLNASSKSVRIDLPFTVGPDETDPVIKGSIVEMIRQLIDSCQIEDFELEVNINRMECTQDLKLKIIRK